MNATFPKSERLCSKIEIEGLFANGETRRSGGFTVNFLRVHVGVDVRHCEGESPKQSMSGLLHSVRNDVLKQPLPKILISVPKRFQKRSVDRNRTKRLIREVYRKHKAEYLSESNIYALAIIYSSPKIPNYAFVEEHVLKLLEKIK